MGLPSRKYDHARYRDEPGGQPDRRKTSPRLCNSRCGWGISNRLILALSLVFAADFVAADTLRVATYNVELHRKGPGLLLRDILRGEAEDVLATTVIIAETKADILVLQGFDYDLGNAALKAFEETLATAGHGYPYIFAARPNTGMQTGLDLDGDGRRAEPRDAQGYGRFSGQGGMAVLSRHPILEDQVQDFSDMLWRDLPDALLPYTDEGPFPSQEVQDIQRLSTTAHWVVPVDVPEVGRIDLLTFYASPPVFDGPEDRNGKRNHDEIVFWKHYMDGAFGPAQQDRFVLLGDTNQDTDEGEGIKSAIRGLLADPRLQDPEPKSDGSVAASGDPFDTADWDDPVPGNLRVDYVLPSSDWQVVDTGVVWPSDDPDDTHARASRHKLVWVDLGR